MICPKLKINYEFNIKDGISSNTEYRKSEFLSYGQKAVCILSLIVKSSTLLGDIRPLVIDQPEDDLDNLYIFTNLVKQLRSIKSKRQLILATHNSNVLIGTEAEHVIVLESDGNFTKLKASGSIDKRSVKLEIIKILEGNSDALKMRLKRYSIST